MATNKKPKKGIALKLASGLQLTYPETAIIEWRLDNQDLYWRIVWDDEVQYEFRYKAGDMNPGPDKDGNVRSTWYRSPNGDVAYWTK